MHREDRYAEAVLLRQVELLYDRKRWVILAFPVLGLLYVGLLHGPGISPFACRLWLALLCATTASGVWQHAAWRRRSPAAGGVTRWLRLGILNSGLNGLAFGLAAVFLFPPDPARQAYLLVLIAGITSTAIASSGSVLGAYLAFLAGAIVPVVARFGVSSGDSAPILAAITALYGVVMAGLARAANATITESIRLALDNRGLVEELSASNRELEARVAERTAELERTEEKFRQAQKLEAVGRLAGGVAHDFNNTLTIILGHAELLMESRDVPEAARLRIGTVRGAAERAAGLTRQLLAFSRRQMLQPRIVTTRNVLDDLDRMLHRLLREDVELAIRDESSRRIMVDPDQLSHALMNLVVNALDAITGSGRITVTSADRDAAAADLEDHPGIRPGPGVEIAVSDTGCGMDAATQLHIFEPFFTTKEQGKGTGLGLPMVWGIVAQSSGFIRLESEVGTGSTFRVWLPAVGGGMAA